MDVFDFNGREVRDIQAFRHNDRGGFRSFQVVEDFGFISQGNATARRVSDDVRIFDNQAWITMACATDQTSDFTECK